MASESELRRLVAEWDLLLASLQGMAPARADDAVGLAAGRVGVTILAGFLGSGKTTMLRHFLEAGHGLKLAAVVNDIGAINIDAALVARAGGGVVELTNGCSCCALGPELGSRLGQLASQPEPPDAILIEASGIADPAGIATVVAGNGQVRLDGIITVVDATALHAWLDDQATAPIFRRQLEAAHVLALNKIDLADDAAIAAATARLAALVPGRPVIAVAHGRLDTELALGAALHGARPDPADMPHHADRFLCQTIELAAPIDRRRLAHFLTHPPAGLLRVKGFVETLDAPGVRQLVQAIGRSWSIEPLRGDGPATRPRHGLVLIGLSEKAKSWAAARLELESLTSIQG